ncbi:MAG: hypothetical protein ACPG4X_19675 [Pikeienuella sp.]
MTYDDYTDWSLVDFDEPVKKPAVTDKPVDGKCPKCGRELKARGAHFHIKACRA